MRSTNKQVQFFNTDKELPTSSKQFQGDENRPAESDMVLMHHTAGHRLSVHLELSNGMLLTGTSGNNYETQVCLWEVPSGNKLSEIILSNSDITHLSEIRKNIVAIAQWHRIIDIYDFHDPANPVKLTSIKLPDGEYGVTSFALSASGRLAMVTKTGRGKDEDQRLSILDFDVNKNIFSISQICDLPDLGNSGSSEGRIFWLNDHTLAAACYRDIRIVDLQANNNQHIKQIIPYPDQDACHPSSLQLQDGKVMTAHVNHNGAQLHTAYVWDLLQDNVKEPMRTINLPVNAVSWNYHHMYQKSNGDILIIADAYDAGNIIMKINLANPPGEELVVHRGSKLGGFQCSFLDDGRYMFESQDLQGKCIRVPKLAFKKPTSKEQEIDNALDALSGEIKKFTDVSGYVKHGMYANQKPAPVRMMNEVIDNIRSGKITPTDGTKKLITMANDHQPIQQATRKLQKILNMPTQSFDDTCAMNKVK